MGKGHPPAAGDGSKGAATPEGLCWKQEMLKDGEQDWEDPLDTPLPGAVQPHLVQQHHRGFDDLTPFLQL